MFFSPSWSQRNYNLTVYIQREEFEIYSGHSAQADQLTINVYLVIQAVK